MKSAFCKLALLNATETETDQFSASYFQKRKYHILVLVFQKQIQPAGKTSVL